jgi:phosphatidylserine synthase
VKKYGVYLPHIVTLCGLAFAALALMEIFAENYDSAVRYSLLVLLVDRFDGTLARKLKVSKYLPGVSGETLDTITDMIGLSFVPMIFFWKIGLFLWGLNGIVALAAILASSWKYSRKEAFLRKGYSEGAPPIFFSLYLCYFLKLPAGYCTLYALILIFLVLSKIKYPITSLVTTHWKPGFKSITNYLTIIFFIPVIILLDTAPPVIFWVMFAAIIVQLTIYPALLTCGVIKPVFNRNI